MPSWDHEKSEKGRVELSEQEDGFPGAGRRETHFG